MFGARHGHGHSRRRGVRHGDWLVLCVWHSLIWFSWTVRIAGYQRGAGAYRFSGHIDRVSGTLRHSFALGLSGALRHSFANWQPCVDRSARVDRRPIIHRHSVSYRFTRNNGVARADGCARAFRNRHRRAALHCVPEFYSIGFERPRHDRHNRAVGHRHNRQQHNRRHSGRHGHY